MLSEHPYLYCEHNPVMRVDPSGRAAVAVAAAIVGAALTVWAIYEFSKMIGEAHEHNPYNDKCYNSPNPEDDCRVDLEYLKKLQEKVAKQAISRYVEAPIEKTLPPGMRLINGLRKLVVKIWEEMRDWYANNPPVWIK